MATIRSLFLIIGAAMALSACGDSNGDGATDQAAAESAPKPVAEEIREAAEGEHRSESNRERNAFRNPVETLTFFGLEPDMTVIEIWPGGGWYTEVLAPVLRDEGKLIAADFPEKTESDYLARVSEEYRAKLEAEPTVYDHVELVGFGKPDQFDLGPSNSADLVLLPRNFHNFIRNESVDEMLAAVHDVLKPGGVFGVVQHRAREDAVPESEDRSGYVRESYVVEQAESAGFRLDARSEINANPNDDADYPAGVWSLPPSLAVCRDIEDADEKEECEAKWREIGESDRMTLRFVKPGQES